MFITFKRVSNRQFYHKRQNSMIKLRLKGFQTGSFAKKCKILTQNLKLKNFDLIVKSTIICQ